MLILVLVILAIPTVLFILGWSIWLAMVLIQKFFARYDKN